VDVLELLLALALASGMDTPAKLSFAFSAYEV
jgi:hypothetical protein